MSCNLVLTCVKACVNVSLCWFFNKINRVGIVSDTWSVVVAAHLNCAVNKALNGIELLLANTANLGVIPNVKSATCSKHKK